jgi:hypothetical protein
MRIQIQLVTPMQIRILLDTLMRIRNLQFTGADLDPSFQIKAKNLEEVIKIGSYSAHFGLSSAN